MPIENNSITRFDVVDVAFAEDLRHLEATADICELFSVAFAFPSAELAEALCSGSFQADLQACADELGMQLEPHLLHIEKSASELYKEMRREYSRLYLSPGKLAIIYPYESAFLHVARGIEGMPTLFANNITLDVERYMKLACALPDNARKEPVDSVFSELDLLRLLYTLALAGSDVASSDGANLGEQWLGLADEFYATHIKNWLPDFLQMSAEHSRIDIYKQLANVAQLFFAPYEEQV